MALEKQVLTKKEKAVMRVIYKQASSKKGMCLLSPIDIFSQIPLDLDFEEDELDITLRDLEIDDFFDVTRSDKKGELVYCINMHQKGLAFARVEKAFKTNLRFKIILAVVCSIITSCVAVGIRMIIPKLLGL